MTNILRLIYQHINHVCWDMKIKTRCSLKYFTMFDKLFIHQLYTKDSHYRLSDLRWRSQHWRFTSFTKKSFCIFYLIALSGDLLTTHMQMAIFNLYRYPFWFKNLFIPSTFLYFTHKNTMILCIVVIICNFPELTFTPVWIVDIYLT